MWVKMLQRMNAPDKILTVRNKYNNTLEALLAESKNHYIVDINPILSGSKYFTQFNELNEDGRLLFWKELDECIKFYDKHKLTLIPRQVLTDRCQKKSDSAAQLRFKLPPPPPDRHQHRENDDTHPIKLGFQRRRHCSIENFSLITNCKLHFSDEYMYLYVKEFCFT